MIHSILEVQSPKVNWSHKGEIDMISTTSIPNNNKDIEDNNVICEANGCYKQAKNEIKIKVGQFGQIKIFL